MREITGNILDLMFNYDAVCITTNGFVKSNGENVMGAGVAGAFKEKYPNLPLLVGSVIKDCGNHSSYVCTAYHNTDKDYRTTDILTLPTKPSSIEIKTQEDLSLLVHYVRDKYKVGSTVPGFHALSNFALIKRSLEELVILSKELQLSSILLPRPGCSNGGLKWGTQIKYLCESILDNRFTIITL